MSKGKIASQMDNAPDFNRKHSCSAWYFNTFLHQGEAYFDTSHRFGFCLFVCSFFSKTDCRVRYWLHLANLNLGMVMRVKHSREQAAGSSVLTLLLTSS